MAGKTQRKQIKKARNINFTQEVNRYLDSINAAKDNISEKTEEAIRETRRFIEWKKNEKNTA